MLKKFSSSRLAVAAAAILAGAAGCRSDLRDLPGDAARPRIGVVLPLSGNHAVHGQEIKAGIECAMEQLRREGRDREVPALEFIDDRGSGADAARAVERLASSGATAALVGYLSTEVLAVKTEAARLRFPVLSPTATNNEITSRNDYVLRACFSDDAQAKALAYYARYIRRCDRMAILIDLDENAVYARDLARLTGMNFNLYLGSMVRAGGYRESQTDFKMVLKELIAAAPDVILIPAYPATAGKIVRQARELGYAGLLLGSDSWHGEEFFRNCGPNPGDVAFSSAYSPKLGTPEQLNFAKRFEERNGREPGANAALGYDAGLMIAMAVRNAKTPEEIIANLRQIRNFTGSAGEITMLPDGEVARSIYIHSFKKDAQGKPILLLENIIRYSDLKRIPTPVQTEPK